MSRRSEIYYQLHQGVPMKLNTYEVSLTFRIEAPTADKARKVVNAISSDICEAVDSDILDSIIDIQTSDAVQVEDHNEGGLEVGFTF